MAKGDYEKNKILFYLRNDIIEKDDKKFIERLTMRFLILCVSIVRKLPILEKPAYFIYGLVKRK